MNDIFVEIEKNRLKKMSDTGEAREMGLKNPLPRQLWFISLMFTNLFHKSINVWGTSKLCKIRLSEVWLPLSRRGRLYPQTMSNSSWLWFTWDPSQCISRLPGKKASFHGYRMHYSLDSLVIRPKYFRKRSNNPILFFDCFSQNSS